MSGKVFAHLSKELRAQYKRRSMAIRKGDEVKIIRGEHFGKVGAVTEVDPRASKIFINGLTLKRTIGTEKQVPMEPSKVVITSLDLNDNARQKILLRKVKEVKVEKKPEPIQEIKTEEKVPEKKEEAKPKTVKAKVAAKKGDA